MYFIFIIYSLLKSEHLYIVKLQGIAIKYIGMIFSQFIAIYISIEMFYIWYYKHKYCLNYGNQFILKHFEFFSKNYNSNIFFNLIHTYYNNNNIHFRNIAMIKKNVLLRPKLQRCLSVVYVVHTAMIHISVPSRLQRLAVMKKFPFRTNVNNQTV